MTGDLSVIGGAIFLMVAGVLLLLGATLANGLAIIAFSLAAVVIGQELRRP